MAAWGGQRVPEGRLAGSRIAACGFPNDGPGSHMAARGFPYGGLRLRYDGLAFVLFL